MTGVRRRFHRSASVEAAPTGFRVTLDGRPLRTPAGAELLVPTAALARAIAEEWLAQTDTIRPHTMPATRLAATAIDRIAAHREAVVEQLVAYGGSDLLCYRTEQPGELAARQHRCWQPLLDWVAETWGASLAVTRGVMPIDQPAGALDALRSAVAALDDLHLAALGVAVPACGSLVLGLALVVGRLSADSAFDAAELDETFQIERWGDDDEAAARRARLRGDIAAAEAFVLRARDSSGADLET